MIYRTKQRDAFLEKLRFHHTTQIFDGLKFGIVQLNPFISIVFVDGNSRDFHSITRGVSVIGLDCIIDT